MISIKQNFLNPNKQLWPLLTVYKSKNYWSKSGVFQLEQWFCNSAIYSIFQNTVIKDEKNNSLLLGLALGFSIQGFKTQLKSNLWLSYPILSMLFHEIYRFIYTGSQKSTGSIEPIISTLTSPLLTTTQHWRCTKSKSYKRENYIHLKISGTNTSQC